tara:strand:- start:80409 stop:80909 length:501 start_codon:yes stop_codon:yes gene_type:complete
MSIDPNSALGIGIAPGHGSLTNLGNSVRKASFETHTRDVRSFTSYNGEIRNILLPLRENDPSNAVGVKIQIDFTKPSLQNEIGDHWFRLNADPLHILQTYGTPDLIASKNPPIKVLLRVYAASYKVAEATIVGHARQANAFNNYDVTPVRAWCDIINAVASSKFPG